MKVACTVRSGGKQRKPHSRQRPCGTNDIRHREMLDDIYILQVYAKAAGGIIGDGVTHGLPRPHNAMVKNENTKCRCIACYSG